MDAMRKQMDARLYSTGLSLSDAKKMVAIFGETFFCFKLRVCDKTLRISSYIFYHLGYCLEHQLRLSSSFCANRTGVRYAMECEQTYHAP